MAKATIVRPEGNLVFKNKELPLTLTQDDTGIIVRNSRQTIVVQDAPDRSVQISGPHLPLEAGKTVLYAKSIATISPRPPAETNN